MASKTLKIIPLGGLGEIGKNMLAVEYGENILIVDCGIMFPENDMLGIDYIIPDFSYLEDKWKLVRGLVLTHGHEDHIGAVRHVLESVNIPMYATKLTRGLLEVKLKRAGQLDKANITTVEAGGSVAIGPFEVEFFHVSHSIPDAVGLAIDTPIGLLVHTGDYKFDHTPVDGWPTDFSPAVFRGTERPAPDGNHLERARQARHEPGTAREALWAEYPAAIPGSYWLGSGSRAAWHARFSGNFARNYLY